MFQNTARKRVRTMAYERNPLAGGESALGDLYSRVCMIISEHDKQPNLPIMDGIIKRAAMESHKHALLQIANEVGHLVVVLLHSI